MKRELQQMIEKIYKQYVKRKQWQKVVMVLAAIVVFCTTYALVLPAITLETTCGIEEHSHEASCFENEDTEGLLVCVIEEHAHLEECYQKIESEKISDESESTNYTEAVEEEKVEEKIVEEKIAEEKIAEEKIAEEKIVEEEKAEEDIVENVIEEPKDEIIVESETKTKDELVSEEVSFEKSMVTYGGLNVESTAIENEATELSIEEEKILEEGILNETVWWKVTEDEFGYRTLTIGGEGAMPDFASQKRPWELYSKTVDKIDIRDGVTYIGAYAFESMSPSTKEKELEIKIGKDIKKIGNCAFSGLQCNISCFTVPGNVEVLGNRVFERSSGIKNLVLKEGIKSLGELVFYGLGEEVEILKLPSTLESIDERMGIGIYNTYLKSIEVAEGGEVFYSYDGVLYKREQNTTTGVIKTSLVAYPPYKAEKTFIVENIDEIDAKAFSSCKFLSELYVNGSKERLIFVGGAFSGSSLEYVYFNEYTKAVHIGMQDGFLNCVSLKKIVMPDGFMTEIAGTFSDCSSLEEFTITKSMERLHKGGLNGTVSLRKLTYDVANGHIGTIIFGNTAPLLPRYDLFVGEHVDYLNGVESQPFSSSLVGFTTFVSRADSITFIGENQLVVKEGAMKGAGRPLEGVDGTLWVDSQGIVYFYDTQTLTAKVIYCSPGIKEVEIPTLIEPESGKVCVVTGVESYAFEKSDVQNIDFKDISIITEIASNAFTNCITLKQINDKTTVVDVMKLFENATVKKQAFANTGLESDGTGDGEIIEEGNLVKEDLFIPTGAETSEDAGVLIATSKFEAYTGEEVSTAITFSVANYDEIKEKVFRIYFSPSNSDAQRNIQDSFESSDSEKNTIHVVVGKVEGMPTYYFEIQGKELKGKTFSFNVRNTFPSPSSAGGKMQIWMKTYESEVDAKAEEGIMPSNLNTRKYQEILWKTLLAEPKIEKGATGTAILSASGQEGVGEIRNLSYKITSTTVPRNIETGVDNHGLDIIRSFEYEDVLELPEGFYINPAIAKAIKQGDYNYKSTTINKIYTGILYVKIDGKQINICTLNYFTNVTEFDAEIENGNIKISWKRLNDQNTKEILKTESVLTYEPQLIYGTLESFRVGDTLSFVNNIKLTANYTYQEEACVKETQAVQTVEAKAAEINLKKEILNRGTYFGEEHSYVITVSNTTAYPYENIKMISEPLDSNLYIKPESMEEMFADLINGKRLQIIIKNAAISGFIKGKVTASDGSSEVNLSAANTGIDTLYKTPADSIESENAEIRLFIKNDVLTITVSVGGGTVTEKTIGVNGNYKGVKEALQEIGYFVTAGVTYEVQWLYNGDAIPGDSIFTYQILSNVKDTFMLLGKDYIFQHVTESIKITNKTSLMKEDGSAAKSANTASYNYNREFTIEKDASINDELLTDNFTVEDRDVVEYRVHVTHRGKTDYEVLPVVDLASGAQLLLVPVDKNLGASWTDGLELYGDEAVCQYYILKEGSYKNVWINENVCADSVTVTEKGQGNVHTLIKLYYGNVSGKRDYKKTISYKTLVSTADTGVVASVYEVANTAWINDHQGYRLYEGIAGKGSILLFKKDIVSDIGGLPSEDVLNESEHSVVTHGNQVTYRLRLTSTGGSALIVRGNDFLIHCLKQEMCSSGERVLVLLKFLIKLMKVLRL